VILILAVACSPAPDAPAGHVLASPKDVTEVAEGVALYEVAVNYQAFELSDTFDFTQTLLGGSTATLVDMAHCATEPELADFALVPSPGAAHGGHWWGFETLFTDCDFGGWKFSGRMVYTYAELVESDDESDTADVDLHLAAAIETAERGEQTTSYCLEIALEGEDRFQMCGTTEGDSRDHLGTFEGENSRGENALAEFSFDGGATLSSSADDWDIYRSGDFTMAGHLSFHGEEKEFDFDAYSGTVALDGVQKLTSDRLPYAGSLTIDGFGSLMFDADTPSTGVVSAVDTDGNVSFELDLDDFDAPAE